MRYVEHAYCLANGLMLKLDSAVANGHIVTQKEPFWHQVLNEHHKVLYFSSVSSILRQKYEI